MQNYNFTCYFVWVWDLVSYPEGTMLIDDVWEQGVVESFWTWEGGSNRRLKKIA